MLMLGTNKKRRKKSVDSKKDEWISLFDGKTTKDGITIMEEN